jgi:hypothetical protein
LFKIFFFSKGRQSIAQFEIIFKAEALPPLGFKSYHVTKKPSLSNLQLSREQKLSSTTKTLIGNEDLMLVFDTKKRLSNLLTHDQIYDITQNYGWYEGSPGD